MPLSTREREIAELLAQGASNRTIAERLSISPATVARHVANIIVKLGMTSRSQLSGWTKKDNAASQGTH
jgi:DNA-binding NarL/FixJ family response regulator